MNKRSLLYILAAMFLGFIIPYLILSGLGANIRTPQQQFANALWRGSVYSLFALGYALVFSILGLLNLAHSAVFMWGAFFGLAAVTKLDFPLWAALPVGMLGGGLISVLVDICAFWLLRLRKAPRTAQLISSIGAAVILVNLASIFFGTSPQRFPQAKIDALPINATASQVIQNEALGIRFTITPLQVMILITSLALMLFLQYLVANTKTGRAMRVVAFNPKVASLLSINVSRIFTLTFFLAGALAGAAGVLYGLAFNSMTPFMGEPLSLIGLTVIVLGGLGSIRGTVVGGFLIAHAQVLSVAAGYSWLQDVIVFTALFLTLLIRPQGLLGDQKLDKV